MYIYIYMYVGIHNGWGRLQLSTPKMIPNWLWYVWYVSILFWKDSWNSPGVWTFLDRIRGGFTIGSPPFLSSRRVPQMQSHSHGQLGIKAGLQGSCRSSCGSLAQFRVGICFLHSWVTSSSVCVCVCVCLYIYIYIWLVGNKTYIYIYHIWLIIWQYDDYYDSCYYDDRDIPPPLRFAMRWHCVGLHWARISQTQGHPFV